jgi:hypothetical protein
MHNGCQFLISRVTGDVDSGQSRLFRESYRTSQRRIPVTTQMVAPVVETKYFLRI